MTETSTTQAIARVLEFLPELANVPDETPEAQHGAAMFAEDVRTIITDLERFRDEHFLLTAQVSELCTRIATLSGRNSIARQLADKTDQLATLQQQFDDFRDVCSGHSADRAVEQLRLEDAEAALVRYGNEMTRLCEAAKAFRATRDEALEHLRRHVDHQDDPCTFDHHGFCQTHWTQGSEDGKCGTAEARQWLAEHNPEEDN